MAVQIENAILTQLFIDSNGKEYVTPMAKGTLALIEVAESHSLRLIVGSSAFELKKECPLKTYAEKPLNYVFSPPLAGTEVLAHGTGIFIRLELPESTAIADSPNFKQKTAFEDLLFKYNLLLKGPAALTDEFARKLAMGASIVATAITNKVQAHVDATPAKTDSPPPPAVTKTLDGAVDVSTTAARLTQTAAGSIQQAVAFAGRRLSAALVEFKTDMQTEFPALKSDPNAPKSELSKTATQAWTSVTNAASSLGDGLKDVYDATTTGVKDVIHNDIGPEAAKLSSKVGQTSSNLGDAAVNVFKGTSAIVNGKTFADGVRAGQPASSASPVASTSSSASTSSPVASTSSPVASTSSAVAGPSSAAAISEVAKSGPATSTAEVKIPQLTTVNFTAG